MALDKPAFFCEHCGAPVPRKALQCPSCGKTFNAVKCPSCGFEGDAAAFKEKCPACGYIGKTETELRPEIETPAVRQERPRIRSYRLIIAVLLLILLVILWLFIRLF